MTARSNWDEAPVWFKWMLHEIGIREIPGSKSNPRILAYREIASIPLRGDDGAVPWCAIGANAAFEANGIRGTRSGQARSFEHDRNFISLSGPAIGAVATFWRGSKRSGLGHVGFYRGEAGKRIYILGANQGDSITITSFPIAAPKFGFVGYWWPKSVPLPKIGPITINAGMALNSDNLSIT